MAKRRTQFEIWVDTFKPVKNTLDPHAADGITFETYGKELAKVEEALAANPETVWTLVDGDNGNLYVSQGYRRVNRQSYFITEVPYDPANPDHVKRYGSRDIVY